jgi:hypothetical protein
LLISTWYPLGFPQYPAPGAHRQVLTMPTRTDDLKISGEDTAADVEKPWGDHGDLMVFNGIKWALWYLMVFFLWYLMVFNGIFFMGI